jgi:hypothetical protein
MKLIFFVTRQQNQYHRSLRRTLVHSVHYCTGTKSHNKDQWSFLLRFVFIAQKFI